jgi:hypothetical protein
LSTRLRARVSLTQTLDHRAILTAMPIGKIDLVPTMPDMTDAECRGNGPLYDRAQRGDPAAQDLAVEFCLRCKMPGRLPTMVLDADTLGTGTARCRCCPGLRQGQRPALRPPGELDGPPMAAGWLTERSTARQPGSGCPHSTVGCPIGSPHCQPVVGNVGQFWGKYWHACCNAARRAPRMGIDGTRIVFFHSQTVAIG